MTDCRVVSRRGGMSAICFVAALTACKADSEFLEGMLKACTVLGIVPVPEHSENVSRLLSSGGDVYVYNRYYTNR